MTTTTDSQTPVAVDPNLVTVTIDGIETAVPKGTLIIRAAEEIGIAIPRFCDHPLLKPVGACRQCLVDVAMPDREGNVRPMPKPQPSCAMEVSPGMVVHTQKTSAVAAKAQHGVMELLLINHPLDCPTCDKGGECPLQNQALSDGRATSRFTDVKRTFAKPLKISTQILLDRERCILCQRCTRFSKEIAGDQFIDLQKRGASQQIGRFDEDVLGFAPLGDATVGPAAEDESGRAFASYWSGNTVQICPVGALTSAAYRFRSRPFDLVSTEAVAEHDANGSAIRIDHRRGTVMRRLAGDDPVVNEEWISDKDRFAFHWQTAPDRLTHPLVRDRAEDGTRGELRTASWAEALEVAATALAAARDAGGVGVLPGGRLTIEDAYAYGKLARTALGTNDIDHRARPASAEEESFLGHAVAGHGIDVTFGDLEKAPAVLLVGFEPEEEGGIVFLRLRKGTQAGRTRVWSLAPFATRGLERLDGTLVPTAPGLESEVVDALATGTDEPSLAALREALGAQGALVLVGERLASVPGSLSAVLRLTAATGARLAWIPRRIGERAGVEMGTLPGLLPGGRPVSDAAARVDIAAAWDVTELPTAPGRDTDGILAALAARELRGVVVGGVELGDLTDPVAARAALEAADVVVSLEVRASEVTDLADVVLPVAPPAEKSGSYLNWEGRVRAFRQALESHALPDHRVLDELARHLGTDLGARDGNVLRKEIDQLGAWDGERVAAPATEAVAPAAVAPGTAVLASWHLQLDAGRGQDGEPFLAGTARKAVARLSAATAEAAGVADGGVLRVSTGAGRIELPAVVTDMPDHVVWLPTNSPGSAVRAALGVLPGAVVQITAGTVTTTEEA
ncbi:NADH-quinone oxidoreductase subunit G [Flavimobilis sp. GY10621]|uniref:NADH-quinone oxidoreductase subunit G n=1 Tax=Flavimobilis rhizosphaerae TaxID=2775421 RepID=A0ABR9DP41_9MICO|nr:NADH-quinone oxidoreductase subunit G [Flavimobilis rhizosphaerae]MBD9698699.1 NADH-quinone oxidoreductase subunit G [Flavimobilis rhizosphaerae]